MRRFVENHLGLVLVLSCLAGLVFPGFDRLPNEAALVVLALLMFISCYKLKEGGFSAIRWRDVALFYAMRYGLLPVVMWGIAHRLLPDYATGIFLLSVLPAAVSSPAFASIYGGTVPVAFAIVIVSQLATPLLIPLQFAWIGDIHAAPSPRALFITMIWCIFLPMAAYAVLKKHTRSAAYMYKRNKFFSVLLIAFVIALAIAKQRDIILGSVGGLLVPLVITLGCFACYIAFGWWFAARRPAEERITYATCSCFNNAALGVTLALLHFPPPVVLFVAVSEMAWALLPGMLRAFLRWRGVSAPPPP